VITFNTFAVKSISKTIKSSNIHKGKGGENLFMERIDC